MDPITILTSLETIIETETERFKGNDKQIYARFRSNYGVETICVDSERFKGWLTQRCLKAFLPVKPELIKLAIGSIKAKDWPDLDPVCVRVGSYSAHDVIYWDLSDGTGSAIEITASGWKVVADPAVLFPTHEAREGLGQPMPGGSFHGLRKKFGLSAENEALIISFCLACLKGKGPYPILAILGPDGCGNTEFASYLRAIVDPATPVLRNIPKNQTELAITARDNHVVAYDDIHAVPSWFGSAICKLSKGTVVIQCRGQQEHVVFHGARPVILVGSDENAIEPRTCLASPGHTP